MSSCSKPVAPSVTFVMPNFNHARFLRSSIGALLNQTRPADKILIFDDASTDNSLDILHEFAALRSSIELVARKKNIGVVANLNEGLKRCKTELIVFSAADDLVFPDFLQCSVTILEKYPYAAFVAACAQIRDAEDNVTGHRPFLYPLPKAGYMSAENYRRLLRRSDNHFLAAVSLYRAARLRELGGFDETLGPLSDGLLTRRLAARYGFCFIPRELGVWRNYGTNYSSVQSMEPAQLKTLVGKMRTVIKSEPQGLFDVDYADRLARRMCFNGARLLIVQSDLSNSTVQKKLAQWSLPVPLARLAAVTGQARRWALLLYAYLRFKPFSLNEFLKQRLMRLLRQKR